MLKQFSLLFSLNHFPPLIGTCIPPASNCYIVTFIAACSFWKSSNTSYSPSLQSSSFHCATLPLNFSIGSDIWLHFQCANMEGNPWVISSHMVMSQLGVHQLLQWSKMQLLAKTPLVWLAFSINAYQSNWKYTCTLGAVCTPPQQVYLLFGFSRV